MPREGVAFQTLEQDVLYLDETNSLFVGRPQVRHENMVREYNEYRPQGASGFGDVFEVLPPRAATYLGPIYLKLTTTAIASVGAGANYPRFPDYWPYHAIEKFDASFAGNHLQSLRGDDMFIIHAQKRTTDDNLEQAVDGGLQDNEGQRAINAQAARTRYLPIPAFWCGAISQAIPYDSTLIRQEITCQFTMRSIEAVIETDGATPTGTLVCRLLCEMYHLDEDGVANVSAEMRATNPDLGTEGYSRMCRTMHHQTLPAVDGTDAQTVALTQLRRPTTHVTMVVRKNANITTAAASARDRYLFEEVALNNINSSSRQISNSLDHVFQKHIENTKLHAADSVLNMYTWSSSVVPDSVTSVAGYTNYTAVGAPEWAFTLNATHSGASTVEGFFTTLNTYVLNPRGNLRMLYQ